MSLQGSLETFALPDVLVLLASTKKDGELRVVGGRTDGRVWVEKGQIVHAEINSSETPSVEAVFQLLRLDSGSFSFEGEKSPPSRRDPETIDLVLADAQVRLSEWKEIAKVVPHLGVLVDMADTAPSDEVTVSASQWKLLRAVAGGSTISRLMERERLNEFDACRTVKELFEASLVSLDLTPKPVADERPEPPAPKAESAPAKSEVAPAARKEEPAQPAAADRDRRAPAAAPPKDKPQERPETRTPPKPETSAREDLDREIAALVDEAAAHESPRKVRAVTSELGSSQSTGADASRKPAEEPKAPEDTKAFVAKLAALEGENEEKIAKKVEEHLARGGELPEVGEGDEPINRGLLLKFLSSVRN